MDKHSKLGNCRRFNGKRHQLVFNILSTGLSTGEVENFFSMDRFNGSFCHRFGVFLELKLLCLSKIVIFAPLYNK